MTITSFILFNFDDDKIVINNFWQLHNYSEGHFLSPKEEQNLKTTTLGEIQRKIEREREKERERERERESVYPSENKELMLLTNLRIAYICYAERMDSGWMLRVT